MREECLDDILADVVSKDGEIIAAFIIPPVTMVAMTLCAVDM